MEPTASRREQGPLERMLTVIPDTPETRLFFAINDYARLRELTGTEISGDPVTQETIARYYFELMGYDAGDTDPAREFLVAPAFVSFGSFQNYREGLILPEYAGYSFLDVDQDVVAGWDPPRDVVSTAARIRVDAEHVMETISSCDVCPPPELVTHSGVTYFRWGEDAAFDRSRQLAPPAFDNLGRGLRMTAVGEYVLRTMSSAQIESMIDAYVGGESLARHEDIREAIRFLDERRVYAAYGTTDTQSVGRLTEVLDALAAQDLEEEFLSLFPRGWPPPEDEPVLRPYTVMMIAGDVDEEGQFIWVVLVHDTAELANENVSVLPQRAEVAVSPYSGESWTADLELEEVAAKGRLLVAKIRSTADSSLKLFPLPIPYRIPEFGGGRPPPVGSFSPVGSMSVTGALRAPVYSDPFLGLFVHEDPK